MFSSEQGFLRRFDKRKQEFFLILDRIGFEIFCFGDMFFGPDERDIFLDKIQHQLRIFGCQIYEQFFMYNYICTIFVIP
ncbi:hypothetical protein D3C86_1667750 [compost metagenome]